MTLAKIAPAATTQPFRSRVAELPSCTIRYLEAGDPDATGNPILMLHGWPQDALMWRRPAAGLAGKRRLIAPDLRGFGRSGTPGYGYNPRYFVLDQVALLNHLGIAKVDIIGHDWGGWTALLMGLERPERVGSILAASTPHPWIELRPKRLRGSWRMLYTTLNLAPGLGPALHRHGRYTRAILGAVAAPDRRRQSESLRAPARARAMRSLYGYYYAALGQVAKGRWDDRRLSARLHLISGHQDRLIPSSLFDPGELTRHAPAATLELVPGAGHFLVDERPELILARARDLFGID